MSKVLIATEKPFAESVRVQMVKDIEAAGLVPVVLEKYKEREDLLKAIEEVEGVIIRSDLIKADCLERGKKLKIVIRAGAGTDNVDADVKGKIVVENTPGQNSNAVAELAFGMMIMAARGFYDGSAGFELKGKILGLHAFGAVGKCMAKIASGFGMEVRAFDPYLKTEDFVAAGIKQVTELKDLYTECDFISLHIPSTAETKKSINYDLLSLMKPQAVVINTARADVICDDSMERILAEKPKFKYATDVKGKTWDALYEKFKGQLFGSPKKMGAQTFEANLNAGYAAVSQIIAFLKDGKIMYQVKK